MKESILWPGVGITCKDRSGPDNNGDLPHAPANHILDCQLRSNLPVVLALSLNPPLCRECRFFPPPEGKKIWCPSVRPSYHHCHHKLLGSGSVLPRRALFKSPKPRRPPSACHLIGRDLLTVHFRLFLPPSIFRAGRLGEELCGSLPHKNCLVAIFANILSSTRSSSIVSLFTLPRTSRPRSSPHSICMESLATLSSFFLVLL